MESDDQKPLIINSLKLITGIFSRCKSDYRVVGSVLIVAYKNNIFRHVHDIDILLDSKTASCVYDVLKENGFTIHKKRWGCFTWHSAEKKNYLGFTFMLVGKFTDKYFSYAPFRGCELRIYNDYLNPTEYNFNNIKFIGIPVASTIAGIKQSFLNPKRSLDKQILREEIKMSKKSAYGNIVVYLGGVKIPYLYDIFSFIYNIYGGLRILAGGKYEAWKN